MTPFLASTARAAPPGRCCLHENSGTSWGALEDADTATTLRVRDGRTLVGDGPFIKTGEFITAPAAQRARAAFRCGAFAKHVREGGIGGEQLPRPGRRR